jgi:epoxyqueuosine reductase
VTVLTDAPLEAGKPLEGDCGDCRACVAACPAGAIHASSKDFDLSACKAKLDEFVRLQFIGQHICGVCVKACKGKRK